MVKPVQMAALVIFHVSFLAVFVWLAS